MHHLDAEALETIDAALFSGDAFHNADALATLETYLARWNREAASIKQMLAADETGAPGGSD